MMEPAGTPSEAVPDGLDEVFRLLLDPECSRVRIVDVLALKIHQRACDPPVVEA